MRLLPGGGPSVPPVALRKRHLRARTLWPRAASPPRKWRRRACRSRERSAVAGRPKARLGSHQSRRDVKPEEGIAPKGRGVKRPRERSAACLSDVGGGEPNER